MAEYVIRDAVEGDCAEILRLIVVLAEYEEKGDEVHMDKETLQELMFGKDKIAGAFIVEKTEKSDSDETNVVGFLLYYWSFSSWEGRGIFIEDVYVLPEWRRKGIGSALWKRVLEIGAAAKCKRAEWRVLDWNKGAIAFYKKLGAVDLGDDGYQTYRMHEDAINKAIASL